MRTRVSCMLGVAFTAMAVLASGCLDRELKPLNPCLVSGVSRKVAVNNVDKVDLLFMVDNSNSMAEEQEALKLQFPKLINVLTTGMRSPTDENPFPPAKDLHVGVVSSDMGIPGVNFGTGTNCLPDGGDDGRLQHTPRGDGCDMTYPTFLSYSAMQMNVTTQKFANDFACIASLGTGGCGFEQQLESPLKALWPSNFTDTKGNLVTPNPITFLATTPMGQMGRGDIPPAQDGNLGFLRNDIATGLSLIAIVLVTDEEDCSSRTTEHLLPQSQLKMDSPFYNQDINLRCHYNPDLLYDVEKRYLRGFRLLRQDNEQLVVFAAITGVPTDLVDLKNNPIDFSDEAGRNAWYDNILNDDRMIEKIDQSTMPGTGTGNLQPSCVRTDTAGRTSKAFPPRRIVQLAKLFGENGVVQSICQEDFGEAMNAIINVIAKQLGAVCLPRPLVRKSDGLVGCNVVWELPPVGAAPMTTPTTCEAAPSYLEPVTGGRATVNDRKGNNCKVKQLAVRNIMPNAPPPEGDGWYYDTFTDELAKQCNKSQPQRVAFTATAKPPTGVIVKLECLNETQRLANTTKNASTTVPQPEIGTPCGMDVQGGVSGDAACVVAVIDPRTGQQGEDRSMFCHPELNTCVLTCGSSTDCPAAWVCDNRPITTAKTSGKAYCVNPTCGADTEGTEGMM
jgi:hypothetical protein